MLEAGRLSNEHADRMIPGRLFVVVEAHADHDDARPQRRSEPGEQGCGSAEVVALHARVHHLWATTAPGELRLQSGPERVGFLDPLAEDHRIAEKEDTLRSGRRR